MTAHPLHRLVLASYFAAVYLALLWINAGNLDLAGARQLGSGGQAFVLNAFLSYSALYLLPALALTWLAGRPALWRAVRLPRLAWQASRAVAVSTGTLTLLYFFASAQLHALYGMFVNGFVINLVLTPGGLESLGGSDASQFGFVLVGAGFLAGNAGLMALLQVLLRFWPPRFDCRRLALPLAALLLVSTVGDRMAYAWGNAFGRNEMLVLTQGIPHYVGTTARGLFKTLGFRVAPREQGIRLKGRLNYPARPIAHSKPARPYNIVWLVSESWRADTLNAEIMPATWAFAQQAQNFRHHYSGGNGTRIGIFTMLTGVPGSYWPAFLEAHQGAPIIDVLQQQGYQMALYTSAKFSYPEFDQTVFRRVPRAQMHELEHGAGWQRDRENVGNMLDFIDRRDPARPFFAWMFFESPHARYYFPPESVIRTPYQDDINYATLSKRALQQNIGLIHNRYLNAVHHLDSQFARVFDYLKAHDLLQNTIVVVTGDHGEEFMEHGYWGHNSTFSDPQTRTPLVLWVPGRAPAGHARLTSHLDIPATLMPLLGVRNPAQDYSSGYDLLSDYRREHVLLSDWSHVGYKDQLVKITLPINAQGALGRRIVGANDEILSPAQAERRFQTEQPHLVQMLRELGRFSQKGAGAH